MWILVSEETKCTQECNNSSLNRNGGDYSFFQTVFTFKRGKELATVTKCSTSAEFAYSDDGYFDDSGDTLSAIDVVGGFSFTTSQSEVAWSPKGIDCMLEDMPTFELI